MAGLVPPEKLEQIRAASDIVDVIGAAIPLKRAGANFVALCPFHREKTPSFNVNPHRQIFHCFGCHKGGDVFTFIREYENLSFIDAVKRLAERSNIPLEFENQPGQRESRALKDTLLQMHEQIARRWQTALANDPAGQIARDYLAKRGVAQEAVEVFRLGFAPEAWDDTVNWSKSKGYELPLVEQAGLIIRKEDTDRFYDRFRGRLMFPICDEQGRVVAFSGRVLSGDEKTAKYVNSPETPIFTKGKVFYGLDKSKRAILDAGFAVICEGQLDLIACFMAGVKNIVAPQGTAFTGDHARILKRYVNEVVLCFDSDNAGQNAAARVLDSLLGAGLAIRVATVPAPHDPDSFIKERGGEAFQQLINKAEGFFDFYLGRLCATNDPNSDRGRVAIVHDMGEALHKTHSAVLLDTYAQKTALRLGVSHEAVRLEFGKRSTAAGAAARQADPNARPTEGGELVISSKERIFLRLLLQDDDHVEWVASHLDPNWLKSPFMREIVIKRLEAHNSSSWRGFPSFLAEFVEPRTHQLLTDVVMRPLITHQDGFMTKKSSRENTILNPIEQLSKVILFFRNQEFERELNEIAMRLKQPGLSGPDATALLRKKNELVARRARELETIVR